MRCCPNAVLNMDKREGDRTHVEKCLAQLEDVAKLLDTTVKGKSLNAISLETSNLIINLLNDLSSISSRENGERLLAAG